MAKRYFCKVSGRRQAVMDSIDFNGIDYLEVDDRPDGDNVFPQARLKVKFLKPLDSKTFFNKDNVRIDSGERVSDIKAVNVECPEQDSSDSVVIDLDSHGDFSTYTLRIIESLSHRVPPTWLDPVLGEVEFSFKAACPSDFDCAPVHSCPTEPPVEPDIDYLAKDYASFRQLMLDRLSTVMPQWRERNPADLGVAAVEVLAYAADQLSYYQDAVATEAYLGTARRRVSVRRHARLLDYAMHDGCNARAWVHVAALENARDYVLREHTPLLSGSEWPEAMRMLVQYPPPNTDGLEPWTRIGLENVPVDRQVFETMHDIVLHPEQNEIEFYTWGDDDCCLPQGATRASLRNPVLPGTDKRKLDALKIGDLLLFEEIRDARGSTADADRQHRHVVRLTLLERTSDPLYSEGVVNIGWAAEDALPFPLCLRRTASLNGVGGLPVSVVRGNMVLADHGSTRCNETLVPPEVTETRRYRPRLQRTGIVHAVPFDAELARSKPASAALIQDPRATMPAVALSQKTELWTARRDLLASDRFSEDFVVETENDGRAYVRFGDDVLGRRPVAGTSFLSTYRVGGGTSGNVGANTLKLVVIPAGERITSKYVSATNPLPARGGVGPEEIEHVRLYAPQAFRSQRRAVVPSDYAALAEGHPEVQKAVATQRWTGSWHTMFITVDRRAGQPVDDEFEIELRAYLEPYRIMGHDLEIEGPRLVALDTVLRVCVTSGYLRSAVKKALLEVFSSGRLADGSLGFFHPDRLTFGEPIYLSAVIAAAMQVAGVSWVEAERFGRWGEPDGGELKAGRIDIGRLEIARLDNDPNAPNNGRLDLIMEGGL